MRDRAPRMPDLREGAVPERGRPGEDRVGQAQDGRSTHAHARGVQGGYASGEYRLRESSSGLLDDETVLCTRALSASGCFSGYRVIECPSGEEAAANLVRVNDAVLVGAGYPRTVDVLGSAGY